MLIDTGTGEYPAASLLYALAAPVNDNGSRPWWVVAETFDDTIEGWLVWVDKHEELLAIVEDEPGRELEGEDLPWETLPEGATSVDIDSIQEVRLP